MRGPWYRLDRHAPGRWSWRPHPQPRSRFDPASGAFRVRYAGDAQRVAMRERFDGAGRIVSVADLDLVLVELTGTAQIVDLRRDRILDALGLDDQISTGRNPDVWRAGQLLADLIDTWFGPRCHGLVYRSRTTPEASANLAFRADTPLSPRSLGRLGGNKGLLASCIVSDGFTVQGWPESG